MSTFYGLNIARRGLTAAQKGIDVTGHNIANAQTPGYTRQRLSLESIEPAALGSRFAPSEAGLSGGGVRILTVDQIRNPFLDRQFRHENAMAKEYQMRAADLIYIESLFDELSDTGLSSNMNDFLASLQETSKSPTSVEYRTNLIQNAIKLTETFHHYTRQIADKQSEQNRAVEVMTGQINDIATTIGDLNVQIARYELSGQKANDLRDQRGLMLDQLSSLTSFSAEETNDGFLQVKIGNTFLVDHGTVSQMAVVPAVDNPISGEADSLYQVIWSDSQETVQLGRGELKAVINLRDGDTAGNVGLPYINEQINRLARALAHEMNAVHQTGWSLPGPSGASQTGLDFFEEPLDALGIPQQITAANLKVNQALIDDVRLIALASEEINGPAEAGDNRNALKLITLFTSSDLADISNFGNFLESFVAQLAVETSNAEKRMNAQHVLVASIDQQRLSISSVSLDEEMTRLIQLQHSYAASSRMITAIDQNLDVLINRTGMVGR